jgi:hypothetical protein
MSKQKAKTSSELYTEPEMAAMIRMSRSNARVLRLKGNGPPWIRIGHRYLYPARGLALYIKSLPTGGHVPAPKTGAGT